MSKFPKRVQVCNDWYEVKEGWAGTYNLHDSYSNNGSLAGTLVYTASAPFAHIPTTYFVYDAQNNKVGEIDLHNIRCLGSVTNFET